MLFLGVTNRREITWCEETRWLPGYAGFAARLFSPIASGSVRGKIPPSPTMRGPIRGVTRRDLVRTIGVGSICLGLGSGVAAADTVSGGVPFSPQRDGRDGRDGRRRRPRPGLRGCRYNRRLDAYICRRRPIDPGFAGYRCRYSRRFNAYVCRRIRPDRPDFVPRYCRYNRRLDAYVCRRRPSGYWARSFRCRYSRRFNAYICRRRLRPGRPFDDDDLPRPRPRPRPRPGPWPDPVGDDDLPRPRPRPRPRPFGEEQPLGGDSGGSY